MFALHWYKVLKIIDIKRTVSAVVTTLTTERVLNTINNVQPRCQWKLLHKNSVKYKTWTIELFTTTQVVINCKPNSISNNTC